MREKNKFGVKIRSYEAKSLYEYNLGLNFKYDYNYAMMTNSLLLDFLKDNGLKIEKNGETKDVICLKFNQDSRSYEKEVQHWEYLIKEKHSKKNPNLIYTEEQLEYFRTRLADVKSKRDLYCPKKKEDIRILFYTQGVDIVYVTRDKRGNITTQNIVHYNMLYRSTGKAKQGECIFICDRLFEKAQNFIRMGYELPKENAPLVEIGAYSSLISSTIVGKIRIDPKNILIVRDVDSFFSTKVVVVNTDENKNCYAQEVNNYELSNTMFDGQGLIDESIFPTWGEGYVLLRHHMTKMACFKTKIQKFFREYYGENYLTATVKDMFGNEHYVKDIQLITTDNAVKFLKFGISYEYWCDKVAENNCMFGVVKTAHQSKLGDVQRMSYQMVNSLTPDIMPKVAEKSIEYIKGLKSDMGLFYDYLEKNKNFSNDYEVLLALCRANPEFERSSYFRQRKKDIIRSYIKLFRGGKLIQNGDNLVFVGSPYAMLLHAVGEDVEKDTTFCTEDGAIQCFTTRFENGEYLAGFRSPHNSRNNMLHLHNVYSKEYFDYFDLGDQIIVLNTLHTDVQDRANGCDFDSDMGFITNQEQIVESARLAYLNNPTIVNKIPKDGKKYVNSLENFAIIDNNLAKAQEAIGSSSNVAQIAQTYMHSFPNEKKYSDYVCILSVLAQVAIDNAKRTFDVDVVAEINRIQKDMNLKENGYPVFWKPIQDSKRAKSGSKMFDREKINHILVCPMNYLATVEFEKVRNSDSILPMDYFFKPYSLKEDRRKSTKVEKLIEDYSLMVVDKTNDPIFEQNYEEMLEEIKKIYISKDYIGLTAWLINRGFCITAGAKRNKDKTNSLTNKNKSLLIKVLYDINPNNLLKVFSKNLEIE